MWTWQFVVLIASWLPCWCVDFAVSNLQIWSSCSINVITTPRARWDGKATKATTSLTCESQICSGRLGSWQRHHPPPTSNISENLNRTLQQWIVMKNIWIENEYQESSAVLSHLEVLWRLFSSSSSHPRKAEHRQRTSVSCDYKAKRQQKNIDYRSLSITSPCLDKDCWQSGSISGHSYIYFIFPANNFLDFPFISWESNNLSFHSSQIG